MTAFTDTLGFYKGTAGMGAPHGRLVWLEVEVDLATVIAARSAAAATALAAADTLQVLPIPVGLLILQAGIRITEAETTNTTGTYDLGFTGGSPAAANVFGNDIANNAVSNNAAGLAAPLLITTADTLDILFNTAVGTNCVFTVWCVGIDTTSGFQP
jgi:hypothetical protein